VPEKDARKVMTQLSGIRYHGRTVRCNNENDGRPENDKRSDNRNDNRDRRGSSKRSANAPKGREDHKARQQKKEKLPHSAEGWRNMLRGEMPDFTEEGWARRKPKKK
jgi:ATP-dependent RNA helicase DeaD